MANHNHRYYNLHSLLLHLVSLLHGRRIPETMVLFVQEYVYVQSLTVFMVVDQSHSRRYTFVRHLPSVFRIVGLY